MASKDKGNDITYIIPDTHDDKSLEATIELIRKELPNIEVDVFSTGDHLPYGGWLSQEMDKIMKERGVTKKGEAVDIITKEQPEKIKQYWINTSERVKGRADFLNREKYVSIETILGNSDLPINKNIRESSGVDPMVLFNKSKRLKFLEGGAQLRYKGKTLFLLIPHIPEISKYTKEDVRKKYINEVKKICGEIKQYKPERIVILSHETPAPELINPKYKSEEERRGRLSEGHEEYLNMYIDNLKQVSNPASISFVHGHLHDPTKKYKYKGIDMLNLGPWDLLEYNYKTGETKIKKVEK